MAAHRGVVPSGEFAQARAQQDAISKAFRYRDHLSDNEQLLTEASYYEMGPAPDRERAIAAYESLIDRDSTNRSALNNVAILYDSKRDFPRSEALFRRAIAVTSPFSGSFVGLVFSQLNQGKVAAAGSSTARYAPKADADVRRVGPDSSGDRRGEW